MDVCVAAKSRVKKRPDGRYMMQIYLGMVDGKRKYKSVYGASVKEVENKAQEVRVSLGKGLDIAAERDTFAEWSEKYLVLKAGSVSAGHYKGLVSKATAHHAHSPVPLFPLFQNRSRSLRLFVCKRVHNAFHSLPLYFGCEGSIPTSKTPKPSFYMALTR